jgi:hypothetical protein
VYFLVSILVTALAAVLSPGSLAASNIPYGTGDYWSVQGWDRQVPEDLNKWSSYNPWTDPSAFPIWGNPGTGSLAGKVWFDADGNGKLGGGGENVVAGARVSLYRLYDYYTLVARACTDSSGAYSFSSLPTGAYGVSIWYPSDPTAGTIGTITTASGAAVTTGLGSWYPDYSVLAGIVLRDGYRAKGYNLATQTQVVSLRNFTNSYVVPEPSSLLLIASGLAAAAVAFRRRLRRAG